MAITIVMAGGLGNQLFQYASARALALQHQTSLILDLRNYVDVAPRSSRWAWIEDFPIEAKIRTYRSKWEVAGFLPRKLRRIAEPFRYIQDHYGYDSDLRNQPNGSVLMGLFQSPRHFIEVYEQFAHELDLNTCPEAAGNPKIEDLALPESVGIHVRRGDYLQFADFVLADAADYYRLAMAEVAARGERAVVFSDDIDWCREQDFFDGAKFYPSSSGAPYIDLHALSQCRRLVIANSTFSWWAGWFAHRRGAEVTAPKNWLMGCTAEQFGIIPPTWRTV